MQFTQALTAPLLSPLTEAITAVYGGVFNPTTLFSDGSKGVLYDNNDLTAFYLDSAGTTPATVNGLVGLQLDKSQGSVLGSELVTNGDFSGGTAGWTSGASLTSTAAVVSGEFQVTATTNFGRQVQQFNTIAGRWYKATAVARKISGTGYAYIAIATSGEGDSVVSSQALSATATEVTVLFLATAATTKVCLSMRDSGAVGGFDNVTVKALPGNHRYQTTTGSKPILRGTPTGGNLVTNGDFSSATGWTLGTGITISGGKLNLATADASPAAENVGAVVSGRVYRARFTVSGFASGGVSLAHGTSTATIGAVYTANGTFEQYFTATQTGSIFIRARLGATTLSVDDFTLFDVSADAVTAPYGLHYDGFDDFLLTAAVDFSATDKMGVCMGVRKLSDAATGVVASLGDVGATNGSFEFRAPWTAGVANIGFGMKGHSGSSSATYTSFVSPITNVFSFQCNFAGGATAEIIARANGVTLPATGTDTGSTNFANAAFYFGRRTGSALPFNGLDYGGIIVGKALTAAQLASVERWTAQRTGVTL